MTVKTVSNMIQKPLNLRMRQLAVSAFATAAAFLAASSLAATNTLSNSGLESGSFSGWTAWGGNAVESTNGSYYNSTTKVLSHTGAYVGKHWGQFTGAANYSGSYQDVVAGAGSIWSAGGFAFSHELDLMAAGNKFWFEVTFRDSSDTVLALYRSYVLDPASPEGFTASTWYSLPVTNQYDPSTYELIGTVANMGAPVGTVKVRFQATFNQGAGYPGGSVYYDDADLTKISGSDPDIAFGPVSQRKVEGQSVSFTVQANGATSLRYQWQKDGADLSNDDRISGATTATMTISSLTLLDAGGYAVVVTDNAGSVTSGTATLNVVSVEQASNLLLNRGFEVGTTASWTPFNGAGIIASEPYSGSYAAQAYGNGAGSWNGMFQDVPAAPGQAFTADGWFLVSPSAPITGSGECWLEVQFMDASGNMLALYKSDYVTSNTVSTSWMNLQATNVIAFWDDWSVAGQTKYFVAPPGTSTVRYQVTYHGGDGGGAVFFDDMSLLLKLPVTALLTKTGNNLQISWPAQIGVSYQVLYKEGLTDSTWQLLGTATGGLSDTASVSDTVGTGTRFYIVNTL